jgi:CRP-like cAMP-binding protein
LHIPVESSSIASNGEAAGGEQILIPIHLTQGDISDLVGASRKRVNQVMVTFKANGLISVSPNGRLIVCEREGLARYCR